tara:strand:- start:3379 stop:3747 length:369 start_codon:yes stop_codon:yes gene_type:complete
MAICTMTIKDDKTGETHQEFGVGQYWDQIADNYEQFYPGRKVVEIGGIMPAIATKLILDCQAKRDIISRAIDLYVLSEWKQHGNSTAVCSQVERIQLAICMREELTARNTQQEAISAVYISG